MEGKGGRTERTKREKRDGERRPEDEESISCARKRTYVGTRRSGKKKEKERTVHSESKKRELKLGWKKRERYCREKMREKTGRKCREERKENSSWRP